MMDWSGMLLELLGIIAQKHILFYEDYASFACVCKSWHSAAKQAAKTYMFSNGPPSRFPSLVLAQKSEEKEFRELFLLSNKSIRKIRLPQIYDKNISSSSGWLVTVGEDQASQLINPLSCETINLPKFDTIRPELFSDATCPIRMQILILRHNQSSSILPRVIVSYGISGQLGFCQPGDCKWTPVQVGRSTIIYDCTYYNGKVYCYDFLDHIREWDVHVKDPAILVDVSVMPKNLYHEPGFHESVNLIGLDDGERKRLLVVIREKGDNENHGKTKRFLVFAYDLENKNWSKVKDFGTKALFVGGASFWIEEDTSGVIKGNCIYFTYDIYFNKYDSIINGKGRDMGIYHMLDETIEPYFPGESLSGVTPPIWLQSM